MALRRRRMFASGADNAPDDSQPMGYDPASVMPPERPSTLFSPAATPGPRGGGVGGSVDPASGRQSNASGATGGTGATGGASPPGGGAPPIMPSQAPTMPGFGPVSPETASMYTGEPDTPYSLKPAIGSMKPLPMPTVLGLLRMLGRL